MNGGQREREWDVKDGARTIGSCGTGLGPIFTLSSAAVPAASIVHALLLLLTQVMYYARERIASANDSLTPRWEKRCIPRRRLRIQACTRNRTRRSTQCSARNNRRLESIPSSAFKQKRKTCLGDSLVMETAEMACWKTLNK